MNDRQLNEYIEKIGVDHIDAFGQFFTPHSIAVFMTDWVTKNNPKSILDPAVGYNNFFDIIEDCEIKKTGYEIDREILDFFDIENIHNEDFMKSTWDDSFDAIIANPPYAKFQKIDGRNELLKDIKQHTNIELSGLANYSLYFFIKCLYQLSNDGRLAFIMPYDFLDGAQGVGIKKFLTEKRWLKEIIFLNYSNIFAGAITTAAVFLVEKKSNPSINFYMLKSESELNTRTLSDNISICYDDLKPEEKWSKFFEYDGSCGDNKIKMKSILRAKRGIATGCNKFFLLDINTAAKFSIPNQCLRNCIYAGSQTDSAFFTDDSFVKNNKFLFDFQPNYVDNVRSYLDYGVKIEADKGFLASARKAWYILDIPEPAPIWIAPNNRNGIKVIRNLTNYVNLTAFHGLYFNGDKNYLINLVFCYLQTRSAQKKLMHNARILGNGLIKLQPNDINESLLPDIERISFFDIDRINEIYNSARQRSYFTSKELSSLDEIFDNYIN